MFGRIDLFVFHPPTSIANAFCNNGRTSLLILGLDTIYSLAEPNDETYTLCRLRNGGDRT